MTVRVNMHDAKTNLSRLVAAVETGEADEIDIARAGVVVARIVPARHRPQRRPGYWAGRVRIGPDFDELPADVAAAFEGERP
jgi:antitoxin (DNA-binding transcriptional repressor) of toxin-antitoxin stability system